MHYLTGGTGWRVKIGQDGKGGILEETINPIRPWFYNSPWQREGVLAAAADDFFSVDVDRIKICSPAVKTADFDLFHHDPDDLTAANENPAPFIFSFLGMGVFLAALSPGSSTLQGSLLSLCSTAHRSRQIPWQDHFRHRYQVRLRCPR